LTNLRVPADGAYGAVVRGVVAALAALDDPSIDELDDIRLAAQEGFVALVASVTNAQTLEVEVNRGDGEFSIEFWAEGTPSGTDLDGLSMSVLKTLATEVSCLDDSSGRRLLVRLPLKGAR
jgi:serine/threonine-protein kinase RsbW